MAIGEYERQPSPGHRLDGRHYIDDVVLAFRTSCYVPVSVGVQHAEARSEVERNIVTKRATRGDLYRRGHPSRLEILIGNATYCESRRLTDAIAAEPTGAEDAGQVLEVRVVVDIGRHPRSTSSLPATGEFVLTTVQMDTDKSGAVRKCRPSLFR